VMELLAERGIDVSNCTVLRCIQTFGPPLAAEARKHRRPLGVRWYADEMLFFRGRDQWYLSAPSTSTVRWWTCCCGTTATPHPLKRSSSRRSAAQAKRRARSSPTTISRTSRRSAGACQQPCTFGAGCIARLGETTKPIERSHVPTRDRS